MFQIRQGRGLSDFSPVKAISRATSMADDHAVQALSVKKDGGLFFFIGFSKAEYSKGVCYNLRLVVNEDGSIRNSRYLKKIIAIL